MAKKFIGSNQTRGYRQVGTYPITQDNQQILVDLPRGPHIESCLIRVAGTANITTTFTAVRNAGAALFLNRADWVLNSNVTLDSVSGSQIVQDYFTRRAVPANTNPAGFAVGTQAFVANYILDRALQDMVRSKDSMLKTDVGISNNQLRLSFGTLGNMFTGAGVAGYTNVSASVSVIDYQEARNRDGNTPDPLYYIKRNGVVATLPSAGNGQQIKINTGNRLRSISIRVLDGTTREPNIALLTRVRLQRAGDTRVDMTVADMLALNNAAYGVALMTGQVVIDLATIGGLNGVRYSEFWPIPSSADTYLLVDTSASSVLDISTIEGVDLCDPA